tara:strand:- start:42 stop:221 length:180 start_codon:yes stop_codon:yes gene_type:complete
MKKPKGKTVMVRYPEDDTTWYEATVDTLLSIQFTANYEVAGKQRHGFFFYKDYKLTWKR